LEALVEKGKITGYLLNTDHPEGGPKAYFFLKHGFSIDSWRTFESALLAHYSKYYSSGSEEITPFGRKYVLVGHLKTPSNESVLIKSVWFKEKEVDFVKLVTAYPF